MPPVVRVCHPNTQWAAPLKTRSHPNSTVTAIPAAGGMTMARIPARIISTLNPMDHPSDFFTITGIGVDVTLMSFLPRSVHALTTHFSTPGKADKAGETDLAPVR